MIAIERTFGLAWFVLATSALVQRTPDLLTPAQRAAIDRGDAVRITRERQESPWPAVTIFLYVDATPEEAAAVFVDYELHSSYIPNLQRSRVSRVIDASTAEVDYTLELPIVSDERYTVRNRVTAHGDGSFRVDWTLVRASSTKATIGHARFIPYKNARRARNGTLLEYDNFVTPGSRLAAVALIKNRAMRQVELTARAIAQRVELERKRPDALVRRVAALRAATTSRR